MIGPDENNSPETQGPRHANVTPISPFMTAPTVGRIVHYQASEPNPEKPNPMAALVAGYTPEGKVLLHVFAANGSFITDASAGGPDGNTPTLGCWNWPPRA